MKHEIKKWLRLSREHTPIVVGFFTVLVLIALVVGAIIFFKNKSKEND